MNKATFDSATENIDSDILFIVLLLLGAIVVTQCINCTCTEDESGVGCLHITRMVIKSLMAKLRNEWISRTRNTGVEVDCRR